ncbi:MAG: DUF885 domain-containing protein [Armatimonadetes bacterium]|nr:DUF885 domain-containing protein [Armatimonadota bacterium]
MERYATDRAGLGRFYDVSLSPIRQSRMKRLFTEWIERLDAVDFDAMGQDGRVDYLLFKNELEYELRRIAREERNIAEMRVLLPFSGTIIALEEDRRRMEPIEPIETAERLERLDKEIEQARASIEEGLKSGGGIEVKRTVANRAAGAIRGLRSTLEHWFTFYSGYDPMFTWWVDAPYKKVDRALQEYASFVRERVVGVRQDGEEPIIGDPIGREALLSDLVHEMIPYTPEELVEIANREFAWCDAEMLRASRELGYGDDWHKALEYVKSLHVEPGKQDDLVRDQAREAIQFLDEHDLVTIPELCRETWRIEMMPLRRQLVNPYFSYSGQKINVSFPTGEMSHEQKLMSMRGNNIHFSRATVQHELIPGHHLQGFMAQRYRTHRRIFSTPFLGEGWALYWEMLLWDLDFQQTPENRIGMLFWRMHRCSRIILSLSFHLEKMEVEEMIDFLVDRGGHERDGATAEVRRWVGGGYSPLYQCAYMLGGLQLRALHKELVGSGKMTNREFHDAVLKENSIPVEMIRASLTQQELTRDFRTIWKFYNDRP